MKLKFSNFSITPTSVNEDTYTLDAVFSSGTVDRHGEIVDQKSWQLENFMKNPVMLFGHDHSQPPIGRVMALGYNDNGDLAGTVQFAAKEYPFANVIWNLYKGGFMKAFSVGFSAGTVDLIDNQVILKDNELYELSAVSVPANALALAKSKGLDTLPLEEKIAEMAEATAKAAKEELEAIEEKDKAPCPCNKPQSAPKKEAEEVEAAAEGAGEGAEKTLEEKATDTKPKPCTDCNGMVMCGCSKPEVMKDGTCPDCQNYVECGCKKKDAVEAEVTLKEVATAIEKAGKVLSAANRSAIEDAIIALNKVLAADDAQKSIETANGFTKVTIPAITMTEKTQKKTIKTNREINKAIRELLKKKK